MTRFEYPEAWWLLLGLIPLGVGFLWFLMSRRKALRQLGETSLVSRLSPNRARAKHPLKFGLLGLAYVAMICALANPQSAGEREKVEATGVDLMVALDISNSMLAEDIKPNRLRRSKQLVSKLIDELAGERVGLIVFAGQAYLQLPLTRDYVAAKTLLRTVGTEQAPSQGTALAEAISLAEEVFTRDPQQAQALLILSDGEDHQEDAVSIANQLKDKGITIYTLGIGSPNGAPIPVYERGQQAYKMDATGSMVLTKLNEALLAEIATEGPAAYQLLGPTDIELEALIRQLRGTRGEGSEVYIVTEYKDHFQWPLALAVLLLLGEYLLTERKNTFLSARNWFDTPNVNRS